MCGCVRFVKVNVNGKEYLSVDGAGMRLLAKEAMVDISHLLRPAHLSQLSTILKDPEASENDKYWHQHHNFIFAAAGCP